MKIKGIDFTSSPSRKKPITCCIGSLVKQILELQEIKYLTSFEQFDEELSDNGDWVAGLDFPFGQSMRLINNLGWPQRWEDYIGLVNAMSREEFVQLLEEYKISIFAQEIKTAIVERKSIVCNN